MGVAIVSTYPPQGEHHTKMSGVASMSKNIARMVSDDETVHVLANSFEGESDQYIEDGFKIHRCWDRGVRFPWQIVRSLYRLENIDVVHIHHEYDGLYGSVIMNALFPVLLFGVCLTGTKIVTQPHGIVFDADLVNTKSMGPVAAYIPDFLIESILLVFNQLLILLSDTVVVPNVVLESEFHNKCLGTAGSLMVIPHGVEPARVDGPHEPPEDDLTLLYFGYVTWRKGPDILAKTAMSFPDQWEVVIAGGEVPYLSSDPTYREYYDEIRDIAAEINNVTLTGFVEEDRIDSYFREADVLVLPYRKFIAASGVFSLGLRYSIPFVLSDALSPILENPDANELLAAHNLRPSDLSFSLHTYNTDLEQTVRNVCLDPEQYKTVSQFAEQLCATRNWDQLREDYIDLYHH